MGLIFACYLAAMTGFGVYRSCTKYRETMVGSLVIDAIAAIAIIVVGHFGAGVW